MLTKPQKPISELRIYTFCQSGLDAMIKKALTGNTIDDIQFSPAFSRPGFITWKLTSDQAMDEKTFQSKVREKLESVILVHHWGVSIGFSKDVSELRKQVPSGMAVQECTRVFNDLNPTSGEFPKSNFKTHFDLVEVDPGYYFLGRTGWTFGDSGYPGGRSPLNLPPLSPSRAFLKLEEVIQRRGLIIEKNDRVLEIGASPGGASLTLVRRGANVIAIDPFEIEPEILKTFSKQIRHFKGTLKEWHQSNKLNANEGKTGFDWWISDANISAGDSIRDIIDLQKQFWSKKLPTLPRFGLILTLKMIKKSDWDAIGTFASVLQSRLKESFQTSQVFQYPMHHKEVVLVALTPEGLSKRTIQSGLPALEIKGTLLKRATLNKTITARKAKNAKAAY